MKSHKRTHPLVILVVGILALLGSRAAAETEILYPNTVEPLFSIQVPNNWKLTPTQADDQFFLVAGPSGVKMWFRARPISSENELKGAISAARESGKEWLAEYYGEILLEEGVFGDRDGMTYVSVNGTGVSKASGEKVAFRAAFAAMPNGALAQLWCIVPESAPQGEHYAKKVIKSFTPK